MHNLDGGLSFFEPKPRSSKRFLIHQRVQVGETPSELDLFTIERDTAEVASALWSGSQLEYG